MQLTFIQAQKLYNSIQAAKNNEPYPFSKEELDWLQAMTKDSLLYDVSSELRSIITKYLQQIKDVEVIDWNQKKSKLIFYVRSFDIDTHQIDIDNPIIDMVEITHASFRSRCYVPIWQDGKFLEKTK